jgi:hypothetical protein
VFGRVFEIFEIILTLNYFFMFFKLF